MSHDAGHRDGERVSGAPGPEGVVAPAAGTIDSTHPLVELLRIAAPSVVTMTSYTAMQFVDAKMVSLIGPEPVYVAAQGNGGMMTWVPVAMVMGMLGVINTYVSQNLGAGRPERGAAYAWNALWVAVLAGLAMQAYGLALPWIFGQMGHTPEVRALETTYATILVHGSVLTLATRAIAHYFYGMHKPAVVMVAALVGNLANFLLNVVLVFGPHGPPEGFGLAGMFGSVAAALGMTKGLGIGGSALATVIGTGVELSIPLAVFLGPRFNRLYRTRAPWRPSVAHMRDIARIGWPVALMFGSEMICWGYFTVKLAGGFGPEHSTATWIALRYMHMSFMPALGISFAMTAIVGKCMGMKRPDLAVRRAWMGIGLTMSYMGLCALTWMVFRRPLVRFFLDPAMPAADYATILRIGAAVMVVGAIFQVFDALGITMIGALRGAGDTVWPGVLTVILSWTCLIGGGHLMVWARPDLGAIGPWVAAAVYIILLGVILLWRFVRGDWKRIELLEHAAERSEGLPQRAQRRTEGGEEGMGAAVVASLREREHEARAK